MKNQIWIAPTYFKFPIRINDQSVIEILGIQYVFTFLKQIRVQDETLENNPWNITTKMDGEKEERRSQSLFYIYIRDIDIYLAGRDKRA
jgi:hypothetical protein